MNNHTPLKKTTGTLFIISAPSGCGKTSLLNALIKEMDCISVSISYTTRPPRPKEKNGVNYFFVDNDIFEKMIKDNTFVEHAKVFDYYYGTGRTWVENKLNSGEDIVLEIDWQGAQQIKQRFPDAVSIFILPPSTKTLYQRLIARKQDAPPVIEKRIAEAGLEIQHCNEFDYLLVNNIFEDTLSNLRMIISAHRLKQHRQAIKHRDLLENLLKKQYP